MGGRQSNSTNFPIDQQESCQSDKSYDFSIIEDMLIDILSFVPYRDLISNCCLVCSDWKEIIDGHSVWLRKCENEGFKIPKVKKEDIPKNYYRFFYLYMLTKRNFLKNPSGDENLEHWMILQNGGDGFVVEEKPDGTDSVPSEVGSICCFATSYEECKKCQVIDLYKDAISKYLLKQEVVNIKVGEWWAARFDCACVYILKVTLYDNSNNKIDDCYFKHLENQWDGQAWHLVTHTFKDVSKVRYVRFEHSGQDRQFWAGHYGSKMTGAFVELQLAI